MFADVDGKETCKIPTCNELYEESACKALKCDWDPDQYICYKDTGDACPTYDETTCPLNRCDWGNTDPESDTRSCIDKECGDYYEESVCTSKKCTWEPNKSMCYSDNGDACSTIKDYRLCPGNRCAFDYDLDACRDIECKDLYAETDCKSSTLKCAYSSTYYVCYPASSNVPCSVFSYTSASQCPKYCTYEADIQICHET